MQFSLPLNVYSLVWTAEVPPGVAGTNDPWQKGGSISGGVSSKTVGTPLTHQLSSVVHLAAHHVAWRAPFDGLGPVQSVPGSSSSGWLLTDDFARAFTLESSPLERVSVDFFIEWSNNRLSVAQGDGEGAALIRLRVFASVCGVVGGIYVFASILVCMGFAITGADDSVATEEQAATGPCLKARQEGGEVAGGDNGPAELRGGPKGKATVLPAVNSEKTEDGEIVVPVKINFDDDEDEGEDDDEECSIQ